MNMLKLTLAAAALAAPLAPAAAVTIDFENLASGTTLSSQYASLGVTFSPNAFSGPNTNSTTQGWATNSNLTVVASANNGGATYGAPSLISGNVLRSYAGWLAEDGDASFLMTFSTAISSFSATFASISTPADTMLYAYNGATLLGTISATTTGQQVLSFNAPSITRVAIAAGSYFDYVAIDNINFTQVTGAVPEPASWALMIGGFGIAGGALRRRATKLAFA